MQMNFVVQNLINCRSTLSMTAPETDANEVSKNLSMLYNPFSTVTPKSKTVPNRYCQCV